MATKSPTAPQLQKIRITLKSFDHTVIDKACRTILETVSRTGAIIAGPVPLPVHIKKITLNKSTFVHKDSREQYEIRTHKRLIDLSDATPQTIEALSNLHLPAGVDVSVKMITEK
ncbi:30S ribosomal protein S10 [Candidatus Peregrinibacteria bacterium]|nr:30S ribosomal protein S10 [Candidatus Peregrinibacteria bacterium]